MAWTVAIGVDTHKDVHVAVACDRLGRELDGCQLQASGASVFECERPRRRERGRGKSDRIYAALAARRLLSGTGLSRPRGQGRREQLRLLLLERRGVVASRTAALNQLQGVLVSAPERLRQRLGCLHGAKLAGSASAAERRRRARHPRRRPAPARSPRRAARGRLAELDAELEAIVRALVPELPDECGAGAV